MFRPAQGGIYSHAVTQELVEFLRHHGVHGTARTAWGPTVFAVVDVDRAECVANLICERFGLRKGDVIITRAQNQGASWEGFF